MRHARDKSLGDWSQRWRKCSSLAHQEVALQLCAVVDGAFALEHVSDGFDALVVARFGHPTSGHKQNIPRTDCFAETLLAHVHLAGLDHRDAFVLRS